MVSTMKKPLRKCCHPSHPGKPVGCSLGQFRATGIVGREGLHSGKFPQPSGHKDQYQQDDQRGKDDPHRLEPFALRQRKGRFRYCHQATFLSIVDDSPPRRPGKSAKVSGERKSVGARFDRSDQLRNDREDITDKTEVCDVENRHVRGLVNGDDRFRRLAFRTGAASHRKYPA